MLPAVQPGDVVLYQPLHGQTPRKGQVVLVRDPANPSRLITHRVQEILANNNILTKGDANAAPHSTPVPLTSVLGIGRLRIPWIGLPVQLWRTGQQSGVIIMILAFALLLGVAAQRLPPDPPPTA
jgi:signal peptidase